MSPFKKLLYKYHKEYDLPIWIPKEDLRVITILYDILGKSPYEVSK